MFGVWQFCVSLGTRTFSSNTIGKPKRLSHSSNTTFVSASGPLWSPFPCCYAWIPTPLSKAALSQWIPFFSLFKDIVLTFSASLASPKFPLLLEHSHQYINVLYYITHPKKSTLTPYLYSATPPFISLFPVRSNSTVPLSTSTSLLLSLPHSN